MKFRRELPKGIIRRMSQEIEQEYMPSDLMALIRLHRLDTVEGAFSYEQAKDLTRAGLGHRSYFRVELIDPQGQPHVLYMKRYHREPLRWRIRRLLTYGWGHSPASVEMQNVISANRADIPTIKHAYFAHECDLLGSRRSYVLLSEVPGVALEHGFRAFLQRAGQSRDILEDFTQRLAGLVGRLHKSGFVHRDLYTSHIYMNESDGRMELRLIDIARMFQPRWRAFRWRVKDLAQLRYSMPLEWVAPYWDMFMAQYLELLGVKNARRYCRAVIQKEAAMRRRLGDFPEAPKGRAE